MKTTRGTKANDKNDMQQADADYQAALNRFIAAVKHSETIAESYITALQEHSLAQQAERKAHQVVLRVDTEAMNAKLEVLKAQTELEETKARQGTH